MGTSVYNNLITVTRKEEKSGKDKNYEDLQCKISIHVQDTQTIFINKRFVYNVLYYTRNAT